MVWIEVSLGMGLVPELRLPKSPHQRAKNGQKKMQKKTPTTCGERSTFARPLVQTRTKRHAWKPSQAHLKDLQAVGPLQLVSVRLGGSGHAAQFREAAEECLVGNLGHHLALLGHRDAWTKHGTAQRRVQKKKADERASRVGHFVVTKAY